MDRQRSDREAAGEDEGHTTAEAADAAADVPDEAGAADAPSAEAVRERLRRRSLFLRELAEARELRRRVAPWRSRRARIHEALRKRTFRF
ncbi:hypothetical protein [Bailinhaonella thermotolerans]|nr:hypothetical protein [Bailinhaonella thermotolerans]